MGATGFIFLRMKEDRSARVERESRFLAKKISIEPMKKTNLISIGYASADPQTAERVLRSLAKIYLEKHMAVHRPDGELHFFEQQTMESRRQLEDSQQRLLQFTTSHKVISAGQERDLALQKLSEFDVGARQTRIEVAETKQRVWELEQQLSRLPERTTTLVRTADNPELLRTLKSNLLDLQLKRTQLLTKFEPSHRLVQEVDQEIAQTQSTIVAQTVSPVRDETTDKDPHFEWATSELQRAQVQLKALQSRAAAADSQAGSYRRLAEKFGTDAIAQDDLISAERAAEESYLLYVKKREEARMNDALDERGIVNVAIAEQPVAPVLPIRSAWMVLGIGLVAAGAAGTGAAFTSDYLDPAFRIPDDVVGYLDTPVLASLPRRNSRQLAE